MRSDQLGRSNERSRRSSRTSSRSRRRSRSGCMQRIIHIGSNPGRHRSRLLPWLGHDCGRRAQDGSALGRCRVGAPTRSRRSRFRGWRRSSLATIPAASRRPRAGRVAAVSASSRSLRRCSLRPDGRVWLADWAVERRAGRGHGCAARLRLRAGAAVRGRKGRTRLAVIDGLVNGGRGASCSSVRSDGGEARRLWHGRGSRGEQLFESSGRARRTRKIPASILAEYRHRATGPSMPRVCGEPSEARAMPDGRRRRSLDRSRRSTRSTFGSRTGGARDRSPTCSRSTTTSTSGRRRSRLSWTRDRRRQDVHPCCGDRVLRGARARATSRSSRRAARSSTRRSRTSRPATRRASSAGWRSSRSSSRARTSRRSTTPSRTDVKLYVFTVQSLLKPTASRPQDAQVPGGARRRVLRAPEEPRRPRPLRRRAPRLLRPGVLRCRPRPQAVGPRRADRDAAQEDAERADHLPLPARGGDRRPAGEDAGARRAQGRPRRTRRRSSRTASGCSKPSASRSSAYCAVTGAEPVNPVMLVIAQTIDDAEEFASASMRDPASSRAATRTRS